MKVVKAITNVILLLSIMLILCVPNAVLAQDPSVFIRIDREFYEALKAEGQDGNKTYSNNPNSQSTEYLRQIAVSTKYMVDTNIEILKQQEKIIKLLQSSAEEKR